MAHGLDGNCARIGAGHRPGGSGCGLSATTPMNELVTGANVVGAGAACRHGDGGSKVLPSGESVTCSELSTAPVTPFKMLSVTLMEQLPHPPLPGSAGVGDEGAVVTVSPMTFAAHSTTSSPVPARNGAVMKTAPVPGLL